MRNLLTALAVCFAVPAWAAPHDMSNPGHWYDPECCSGEDCEPVRPSVVVATDEGWLVRIEPGDHTLATRSQSVLIPYGHRRERRSQDMDFHVCLGKISQTVYCIYIPPLGF